MYRIGLKTWWIKRYRNVGRVRKRSRKLTHRAFCYEYKNGKYEVVDLAEFTAKTPAQRYALRYERSCENTGVDGYAITREI